VKVINGQYNEAIYFMLIGNVRLFPMDISGSIMIGFGRPVTVLSDGVTSPFTQNHLIQVNVPIIHSAPA
jgi:hypothetical protein